MAAAQHLQIHLSRFVSTNLEWPGSYEVLRALHARIDLQVGVHCAA